MCILLYVKLIWCSGIPYIYGQLEGSTSSLSICAFCYIWNLFGVGVFHRSVIDWRGYMCPRYKCNLLYIKLIQCSGILQIYDQMEGRYICPEDMCTLLYLKLIWCSGIPQMYGQLEEGGLGRCAFCYMLKLCGVVISIHLWSIGGGGHWYVCILVYVKLFWCSRIPYIYG